MPLGIFKLNPNDDLNDLNVLNGLNLFVRY